MAERFANVETMVEFVKKYTPCINGETTMECVERSIRHAPTIEAKPVVHAHWLPKEIYSKYFTDQFECSNCHCISTNHLIIPKDEFEADYCQYCGAQMDESISCSHEDDNRIAEDGKKGVKIPVISMEDVPKIMEEMEK